MSDDKKLDKAADPTPTNLEPATPEGERGLPAGDAPVYGWVRWQGPAYYGGVPTRGSGPAGELTPQETEAWLGGALYEQAIHTDKSYVKIAAPKLAKAAPKPKE